MNIGQKGKETYLSGFSCGEAVVKVIKDSNIINMPPELIKASSAFKTGIGGTKGDLCGCLLAALAAIGVKYGRDNNEDDISIVNQKSADFYDRFKHEYGTLRCDELTKKFRDEHTFDSKERKEFCSEIVRFSAEQLTKNLA